MVSIHVLCVRESGCRGKWVAFPDRTSRAGSVGGRGLQRLGRVVTSGLSELPGGHRSGLVGLGWDGGEYVVDKSCDFQYFSFIWGRISGQHFPNISPGNIIFPQKFPVIDFLGRCHFSKRISGSFRLCQNPAGGVCVMNGVRCVRHNVRR